MQLLIDGQYTPGAVKDLCEYIANELNIEYKVLRPREKDLYKLESLDYEEEVAKINSYNSVKPLLDEMFPGDILITDDIDLANQAILKVTAIISSDGLVFTPERISLLTAENFLARLQGRIDTIAKPLKHRNQEDLENFKKTLIEYLNTF